MKLVYADFVPRQTAPPGLLRLAQYETFDAAVAAAGRWIEEHGVKVLHLETVALPGIWSPYEEGTRDAALHAPPTAAWHQFLRIWYWA